jgi:hypothetical protein
MLAYKYAESLLLPFGYMSVPHDMVSEHPAHGWRRAGLSDVTGFASGNGLIAPVALTNAADGALAALREISQSEALPENGALLLGERARLLGLKRQGSVSPNGGCRLLPTRQGRIALSLPRKEDWELLPALIGRPAEDWQALARIIVNRDAGKLVEQGRLLGLAIAHDKPASAAPEPFTIQLLGHPRHLGRRMIPLVLDFSSLWGGPLAGSLLGACGMRVIKIESTTRPDGARAGNETFYNLLNADKESLALDFRDPADLECLRKLVGAADIVIEGSRPRALAALGIDAKKEVSRGATWLSITAHGRTGEAANWIGYGDDAAVAGGLSAVMQSVYGEPLIAGDAIADPLTGITAAVAGLAAHVTGGARLVSLSLAGVVAHACALRIAALPEFGFWRQAGETNHEPLYPMREKEFTAASLGADTARLIAEFGLA